MTDGPHTPERKAREQIDRQLVDAGWVVQSLDGLNLHAGEGVAVREVQSMGGPADYMLFVDGKALGIVEAKKVGVPLSLAAEQSERYGKARDFIPQRWADPLPFTYESTGVETYFRDLRDPDSRSRPVFAFHTPGHLRELVQQPDTLRARLRQIPGLDPAPLRDCQVEAVTLLEQSLATNRPRALIQMATGSGKTFTAVTLAYRLVKHAGAKRILFLVDRGNLGRQTVNEFQQFTTPDDGRKFTDLYNVQMLGPAGIDPVCKVTVSTIQRLYAQLIGKEDLDDEADEHSGYEVEGAVAGKEPLPVTYNPKIPIEAFDFVIVDECHRSIYNLWKQVLEYFDAFLIGLTATPSKATLGFFDRNLVTEYPYVQAVADGVNVGYDIYRIKTEVSENGVTVKAGHDYQKRDRLTRAKRWELQEAEETFQRTQLDRSVVVPDQILTVIKTFREKLFTEIFPDRPARAQAMGLDAPWVPKTLIFAKDDSHAEDIVDIVRKEFGKGNDFCKKITYRASGKSEDIIKAFRTAPEFRVAVTVDMIATGTDVKPLECLLFLRDVKSANYFEQMKGRGTRTLSHEELTRVSRSARTDKTHFVIVDAVGVTRSKKTDSHTLDKKPTVALKDLMMSVMMGNADDEVLSSLAARLARLNRQMSDGERQTFQQHSGGKTIENVTHALLDAADPDAIETRARRDHRVPEDQDPTETQLEGARTALVDAAREPFTGKLVDYVENVRRLHEQTIDSENPDKVISTGWMDDQDDRARDTVKEFEQYLAAHRDELDALRIWFGEPERRKAITAAMIKELLTSIRENRPTLAPATVWDAYAHLDNLKSARPDRELTVLVAVVRRAVGLDETLTPYDTSVRRRFQNWILRRNAGPVQFAEDQTEWLRRIRDQIALSVSVELEDLNYAPFGADGGVARHYQLFGDRGGEILDEINREVGA